MSFVTREEAFAFNCGNDSLVGILHLPAGDEVPPGNAGASDTGVVIVVGGPQYRAGSHRQFVHLARGLAAAGHSVLRFDVRGMGDSQGEMRNFEQITPDIGAAVDALCSRRPQLSKLVLWGLCDGASAVLLYLHERRDPRITGLALANPWVRSVEGLAKTHLKHYYLQRLTERSFWIKLVRGGIRWRAAKDLAGNVRTATQKGGSSRDGRTLTFPQCMADAWGRFDGEILLMFSEHDFVAKEFIEHSSSQADWKQAMAHPRLKRHTLAGADHTFSTPDSKSLAAGCTVDWLASSKAAPAANTPASGVAGSK